jgi:ribosomal protein S18 acetylase RimI-like enzyme
LAPAKIEISRATEADLVKLIEMYSIPDLKVGPEQSGWFVNCYFDYHHILVARVGGTIQGSCFWRIEGEDYCGLGWVENLYVEEKHRRSGLGEKLLRATISDMKGFYERAGVRLRKVILTTQVNREDARRLYEKVGFREAARLEGTYDDNENDVVYALDVRI